MADEHTSRKVQDMLTEVHERITQYPSWVCSLIKAAYREGGRDVLRDIHEIQCPTKDCYQPSGHVGGHQIGARRAVDVEIEVQQMRFGWWPGHDSTPWRAITADKPTTSHE